MYTILSGIHAPARNIPPRPAAYAPGLPPELRAGEGENGRETLAANGKYLMLVAGGGLDLRDSVAWLQPLGANRQDVITFLSEPVLRAPREQTIGVM
jgi:hypothetical protein